MLYFIFLQVDIEKIKKIFFDPLYSQIVKHVINDHYSLMVKSVERKKKKKQGAWFKTGQR